MDPIRFAINRPVSVTVGVLMVVMGLLRFGNLLKFFPHTLVLGFTSGIAVIILSSQVKDFFGLDMGAVPSDFLEKWAAFFEHFNGVNATALAWLCASALMRRMCVWLISVI